jgi:hypothetical protein
MATPENGIPWVHMAQIFPWKRFWCHREHSYNLSDRGFLVDPHSDHGRILNPNLVTFEQLQDVPSLALLGEPGVGKSWSLKEDVDAFHAKAPELPTVRLDLRAYGSEDRLYKALFEDRTLLQWVPGEHDLYLYLDSFDECLLRIETVAQILADELPKLPLSRLRLRIACRTASWPAFMEEALKHGYGENKFVAAELTPLRRVDVLEAAKLSEINQPEAMLERIDQLQIAAFAGKPVTLKMLLDTYRREGDLPHNLADLYEKGCLILCEEQNNSRRVSGRTGSLTPNSKLAIAARIGAITEFGNRFAVWTGTESAGVPPEDVPVSELAGGTEPAEQQLLVTNGMILETLGTGLFSSRGPERLGWSHQTFAEYLSARFCLTHELPIEQLRSLIFHPRRARVIPQIREVASWLALRNPLLFAEIAEHNPEVLLGSASSSLSTAQREILTAALLRSCDESQILHIHHNLPLRNLAHPNLAGQLESVLRDRQRPLATRYFATRIVADCSVTTLGDALLNIALSDDEHTDLRTIAGYAISDVGSEEEREQLRPLLQASRDVDPNDELRGVALKAIYPGEKYDDDLWGHLEYPRRSLFYGAYDGFLSNWVVPKLNSGNLPAALRWSMQLQPNEDIGPIPELEAVIFALAIENIESAGVAELIVQATWRRAKAYQAFPQLRHTKQKKSADDLLMEDDGRRRRFLEAMLPSLNLSNLHVLIHPLGVLTQKDLPWFIDRIICGVSSSPEVEANLIRRLASSDDETLMLIRNACQASPVINEYCKGLFEPLPPELEPTRSQVKSREDWLREHNVQLAPALGPRIETALTEIENGNAEGWLRLTYEMSFEEGATHGGDFQHMKIDELPGWTSSSEDMKKRILEAAKRYVLQSAYPDQGYPPSRQIRNWASGGVNALALLHFYDPVFLQAQSKDFWIRWASAFVEDGRASDAKDSAIEAVFHIAVFKAPETTNARLLEQLRFENDQEQHYFFSSTIFDRASSESLNILLLQELGKNNLRPSFQGEVLYKLLRNEVPGAPKWAEETIQADHRSERGMALSGAFLRCNELEAWRFLWPIVQKDRDFGRELLEGVSYLRPDNTNFGKEFSDAQLESLYGWLIEQYPPTEDRQVSGAVTAFDRMRFLRDGTMALLKNRGTFEACDAFARIELRFPQNKFLRLYFEEAELLACALTWEAPSPQNILAMAADRGKRFVESSEQLFDLIRESLDRLQAELHGELAAVGDLWNFEGTRWWPKQEEDVSDYIARFLRRDLVYRRIVVNREVQIRHRRRGEMQGQNTDIHVEVPSAIGVDTSPYGTISVVIEVKCTWNDGLLTDMQGQLRDRYLKNSNCRTGLYVAAHFSAQSWDESDYRRGKSDAWEINKLRSLLEEQAKQLSGSVLIRSFVLDVRLDSTKATGIREVDLR